MPEAERAVSFPHQSVAKRAAIVAAGPIANFILAIAIFAGFNYFSGRQVIEPRIEAVQPGSAAEKAGFLPKDLILEIDGRRIETFADMQLLVSSSAGEPLAFKVERVGTDSGSDGDAELHRAHDAVRQAAHRPPGCRGFP